MQVDVIDREDDEAGGGGAAGSRRGSGSGSSDSRGGGAGGGGGGSMAASAATGGSTGGMGRTLSRRQQSDRLFNMTSFVKETGKIRNKQGKVIGEVDAQGIVRDATGQRIGRVRGEQETPGKSAKRQVYNGLFS